MKVNINAKKVNKIISGDNLNYYEINDENNAKDFIEVDPFFVKRDEVKIFISYSHFDKEIKAMLDSHLSSLKRNRRISI